MGSGQIQIHGPGNGGSGSIYVNFPLSTCMPCASGTFMTPGTLDCIPCAPGSFAQYPGSITCMPCPGGTYATFAGSSVCSAVPIGSFTERIDYIGECDEVCEHSLQQNAVFLKLLKDKPPTGMNVFAHYNNRTFSVPDARKTGHDVIVCPEEWTELIAKCPETVITGKWLPENSPVSYEWDSHSDLFKDTFSIKNQSHGNGAYTVRYSSSIRNSMTEPPWNVFSLRSYSKGSAWGNNEYHRGLYIGTATLDGIYFGDWITIEYPIASLIKSVRIIGMDDIELHGKIPMNFQIYGRNGPSESWTVIYIQEADIMTTLDDHYEINTNLVYSELGLVVNRLQTYDPASRYHVNDNVGNSLGFSRLMVRVAAVSTNAAKIVTASQPEFGATNNITSMFGTKATRVRWPDMLPLTFTLCFATRWGAQKNGRVLGCGNENYFGHYDTSGGIYYNSFQRVKSFEHSADWLVMCMTNGFNGVSSVVRDQVAVSSEEINIKIPTRCRLVINDYQGGTSGTEDFHVYSVYVWNIALRPDEMKVVTAGLRKEIGGKPFAENTNVIAIRDLRAYYLKAYSITNPETRLVPIFAKTMYADPSVCMKCIATVNVAPTWTNFTVCAVGFFTAFSDTMGNTCRQCPRGMTTVAHGSESITECVCEAGYYKDPYGFCVECALGSSSTVGDETYDSCACASTGMYKSDRDSTTANISSGSFVSTGMSHTCVLFTDIGRIKCWGSNNFGQLGTGYITAPIGDNSNEMGTNLAFVDLGSPDIHVVDVQVASESTCVLISSGKIKCWGRNNHGVIGVGNRNVAIYDAAYLRSWTQTENNVVNFGTGRSVVSMSVMQASVCAILDNKQVKCFGRNDYGQLGYGDIFDRGDDIEEMGSFLPAVDFGTNRYAVRLFPSSSDTICALLNTADVKCWGHNGYLALGMGIPVTQNIGDELFEMGDNLVTVAIPTGRTVINLWVAHHVVAILDDSTMIAWGGTHL
jgi:hypothetical protein